MIGKIGLGATQPADLLNRGGSIRRDACKVESPKDEKDTKQVIDKIAKMDEPRRSVMQRVHEIIVTAAPELKPRIWYGMPAYAMSAGTPALLTLRNDDRMNMSITEKAGFQPAGGVDGTLMPAAWYFETVDPATEKRIAEIVRSVVD